MEKKQSQDLVKDVFQNSFDKTKFIRFIRELLNSYEEASFVYRGNTIPDAYDQYINTFERVGKYSDGENSIDILIVHLKKDSTLERARTRQRNFIAWYLNGSRGGKQKDAALVAFVSPDSADWRFSLVKMEYKFEEGKNGRTKVKEEFTPAKRWSFLVGSNENSHTAQSRLSPIVEDDSYNPLLKQLEEAFNIEKVTKEFFEKYRDLFLRVQETLEDIISKDLAIKKDFTEKNVNIVDFSKKLLGQIVFLYFLQKKGWFGVPMTKSWGDGDKRFLRTLFAKACDADKNYFNDYLEPLFYEALAKERDDDFYSRFECKIPFLNGGLFDPINNYDWVNTIINIPNDLFSNDRKNLKTGDIGDGILDTFDRYNFTVKEDEPLEKEVAVDPEMLGKVFENLLEVKDRKSKGTYYTPREIVHYMCEQSLINYLTTELEGKVFKEDLKKLIKFGESVAEREATYIAKKEDDPDYKGSYESILPESIGKFAEEIDSKLATIKVCDPAIGSGAFPVGMMSEIVKARTVLSNYIKNADRTVYGFKRDCIQNSLYGVDLDPGAVEIAKLRLWLSLIVDEDDIKQIKPLPNLDYKIMQGNSLIEDLVIGDTVIKFNFDDLVKVDRRTKTAKNLFQKETQYKLFKDKSEDIFDELKKLHSVYFEENNKNRKLILKQKIDEKEQSFISAKCDEEIQRLNTVKKNTQDEKRIKTAEQQIKAIQMTLQKLEKESSRPFFLWKLHFSEVFQENGGFDVVIANPPYINIFNIKEETVRDYLTSHYSVARNKTDLYAFFVEQGNRLLKNKGSLVFIFSNSWLGTDSFSKFRKYLIENTKIEQLIKCPPGVFEKATVTVIIIVLTKEIVKDNVIGLMELMDGKFEKMGFNLSYDFIKNQVSYGFSFNKQLSIKVPTITLGEITKFSLGIKTSDDKRFVLDSKKDDNTYKMLRGKDISRWSYHFANKWIWYKPELMNERKGAGPRNLEYFLKSKILIKDIANEIQVTLDEEGYLTTDTVSIIYEANKHNLRFIIGLLNSRLINKWFKLNFDAGLHIKINQLQNIPVPVEIDSDCEKRIIDLVDKILLINKTGDYQENKEAQVKVRDFEHQIDKLVYKLYKLSEEEIKIVELN